jgi:hypothetical protein
MNVAFVGFAKFFGRSAPPSDQAVVDLRGITKAPTLHWQRGALSKLSN